MASILKVDEIRPATSGQQVLLPDRPAFSILKTTTHNFSGTGDEKIIFNSEIFDVGGVFNTTESEFTAPVAGLYQFNLSVTFSGAGQVARYVRARLYVNGSYDSPGVQSHNHMSDETNNADYAGVEFSHIMNLAANDVISVYAATANSSLVVTPADRSTHFSGYLIG